MNVLNLSGEVYDISLVQDSHQDSVLKINNVVGMGIGHKFTDGRNTGDHCLTVFVTSKMDRQFLGDQIIPSEIGGFKTDVVETGILMAGSLIENKDRLRPAMGGYSVGHHLITAGTLGCCVKDANPLTGITSKYYILSNNHVLANSNLGVIGDPILQPGPIDGGRNPQDIVARLSRFVPIDFSGAGNLVDCAIAEGDFHDLNREIYWVGYVNGAASPVVGQKLFKTGRTTGHTSGDITSVNATVRVNYGGGNIAVFKNQITTTPMSAGGDSGSLMVTADNKAVGLLFAGSSAITIANPIGPVMSSLGIKFL